jgi:hypothetical protein
MPPPLVWSVTVLLPGKVIRKYIRVALQKYPLRRALNLCPYYQTVYDVDSLYDLLLYKMLATMQILGH